MKSMWCPVTMLYPAVTVFIRTNTSTINTLTLITSCFAWLICVFFTIARRITYKSLVTVIITRAETLDTISKDTNESFITNYTITKVNAIPLRADQPLWTICISFTRIFDALTKDTRETLITFYILTHINAESIRASISFIAFYILTRICYIVARSFLPTFSIPAYIAYRITEIRVEALSIYTLVHSA